MHSPTFAQVDACLYRCRLALESIEELIRLDPDGPWEETRGLVISRYLDWIEINHRVFDQEAIG